MKIDMRKIAVAAVVCGSMMAATAEAGDTFFAYRPELAYLHEVNRAGPARDPQIIFLLMAQYANANRSKEGIEFFSALITQFDAQLSPVQKSLYLSATALLRAQHAREVSFIKRISWVNETVKMIDDAKQLSRDDVFVVRWISGVVRAQLPGFFNQQEMALKELQWCVDNIRQAPHVGWLREVYYQLGTIYNADGDRTRAENYLHLSGYKDFNKPITLVVPYAEEPSTGHTFSSKRIKEILPGKVYALSGFEFTEYYFVVSDNGRELIGIDAGTRPDSAQSAYEALRAYAPTLPPLTTVFITHAHWDHVGGHRYFRSLPSKPKFYARVNYADELANDAAGPRVFLKQFFGDRFNIDDVLSFKPDATIDRRTEITVGGTRVELTPITGGETDDALFVRLPDYGVLFVGDFIMPYLGAPFAEEGSFDGVLQAIDVVAQKNPQYILHGHEPLMRLFNSPAMLTDLKRHLLWLKGQVLEAIHDGVDRASLQQANLIPPGLIDGDSAVHVPYLVLRENVINRLYDKTVGYWQPDLQGTDYVNRADRAAMFVDYLDLSEDRLAQAARKMIDDGRYELAAQMLDATKERFPRSTALTDVERLAYLKLKEKYQDTNPFKFIVYSHRIGDGTPPIQIQEKNR